MKSIFEPSTQVELKQRLDKISHSSKPVWGKMNAAQMLAHCVVGIRVPLGELPATPPPFIIRLIGPLFRGQIEKEGIFGKNTPTAKEFLIGDERIFETEKAHLLGYLSKISSPLSIKENRHVFFGKLSNEQWGKLMYKHLHHHLVQFGV